MTPFLRWTLNAAVALVLTRGVELLAVVIWRIL